MKYRGLGKTGLKISEISFGAWSIGASWGEQSEKDSIAALHKALDLGVNFIDTALAYGNGKSEKIIGKVLSDRSEEVYVATKIPPKVGAWPPTPYCKIEERYPEEYLRESLETCLKNLNTECIDILQLHTWTRAWNKYPSALEVLQKFKKEGKIRYIGVSTPEHDQNALIGLMKGGWLDTVQVIYNIFEQEPVAEFLPTALEQEVGVIVRMAFDEGILTGKYTPDHQFPKEDFRSKYFEGDRLERAVRRVEKIKSDLQTSGFTMPQAALKFAMKPPAVSTVISGIRNAQQAERNTAVADMPDLPEEYMEMLRHHYWVRAFWYTGK
ncbi:aldo/keto reductase [Rapidithrix thailandica]|uniref:Aldo/keto reductase n=1 Tax=Rapidithrix thailandica TaxID=413964 RepID=A0AAW9RSR5_9BACT